MQIVKQFPQLGMKVRGQSLVYLDNAATTLKPQAVIDRMSEYYSLENANVHRGAHFLAAQGTALYEQARSTVAQFIGAASSSGVVFTRGTTESLNLLAQSLVSLGRTDAKGLQNGDEIVVSRLEHHSNIVPWQMAAEQTGARIQVVEITPDGTIDLHDLKSKLSARTKVVSLSGCSNVTGALLPVGKVSELLMDRARAMNVDRPFFVVDGAQSITSVRPIGVADSGCDAFVFSGHKLFGPQGIGVAWIAPEWMDRLPPYQGGGSMIDRVTFERTTWALRPQMFEAGTPHVAGAIGLARAIEWFSAIDASDAIRRPKLLARKTTQEILKLGGFQIHSNQSEDSAPIVTFTLQGAHASDLAEILDQQAVAIRAGHHCCQPLMDHWRVHATARVSLAVYTTEEDIERLLHALKKAKELL